MFLHLVKSTNVVDGESGGITIIGLLGSISGSFVITTIGYFLNINTSYLIIVFISGFLGSLFDSILGSTLQSRFILIDGKIIKEEKEQNSYHYSGLLFINNNSVNFLCTLSAPIFFILMYLIA